MSNQLKVTKVDAIPFEFVNCSYYDHVCNTSIYLWWYMQATFLNTQSRKYLPLEFNGLMPTHTLDMQNLCILWKKQPVKGR